MDLARIYLEVPRAKKTFAMLELYPNGNGGVYLKAAFQTSGGRMYVVALHFTNYPNLMPTVFVTQPAILSNAPHRYNDGHLCYLHPNMWNPGLHNIEFVLGRIAKWLNKYEVWCHSGRWPGAEIKH